MDLADIRAQLESELTWRQNEMRLLHNQLEFIEKYEEKKRYRKSLVVMLYSHYEGFCKTAFLIQRECGGSRIPHPLGWG